MFLDPVVRDADVLVARCKGIVIYGYIPSVTKGIVCKLKSLGFVRAMHELQMLTSPSTWPYTPK